MGDKGKTRIWLGEGRVADTDASRDFLTGNLQFIQSQCLNADYFYLFKTALCYKRNLVAESRLTPEINQVVCLLCYRSTLRSVSFSFPISG